MSAIPAAQSYSVIGPVKHGELRLLVAGANRCMKAVAIITPEPKYFVMKKANGGTFMRFVLAAAIGSNAPNIDPIPITNIEDILTPIRPS